MTARDLEVLRRASKALLGAADWLDAIRLKAFPDGVEGMTPFINCMPNDAFGRSAMREISKAVDGILKREGKGR
jgi:hypothetical protein